MTDYIETVRGHFDTAAEKYGKNNVWATMLYGSQNYSMATETSDVDTKTMLFPTVKATVLGKKMNATDLVYTDGSLVGVRDYRDMFDLFMRGNVRFLETLYSKFVVVNQDYGQFFADLQRHRELIANAHPRRLMHSAAGMARQKYEALEHPYPSKLEVLAKYGHDPKQLHHLVRLMYFMEKFLETLSYGASLRPDQDCVRNFLLSLKTDPLPLDQARMMAENAMSTINKFIEKVDAGMIPEEINHAAAADFLDSLALDVFKYRYKIEMEEE